MDTFGKQTFLIKVIVMILSKYEGQTTLVIDFYRCGGSEKNRGGSEKNRLNFSTALLVFSFAVSVEFVVELVFVRIHGFSAFRLFFVKSVILGAIESI